MSTPIQVYSYENEGQLWDHAATFYNPDLEECWSEAEVWVYAMIELGGGLNYVISYNDSSHQYTYHKKA